MSGGIREMGTGLLGAVKDTAGELLGGEGGDAEEMLDADSVEKMMCGSEDLTEGKMMEVEMEGANILLLRYLGVLRNKFSRWGDEDLLCFAIEFTKSR
jgi:hypothetical protein